jgi:hypothetical protein
MVHDRHAWLALCSHHHDWFVNGFPQEPTSEKLLDDSAFTLSHQRSVFFERDSTAELIRQVLFIFWQRVL